MSTPSTSSMMMALLIDKINQLEQRIANTPAPTSNDTQIDLVKNKSEVNSDDESTVKLELDPRTKLMGIGNSEQVAILARVSTPEQKASTRDSLNSQVESCTEQMRALGCKNAFLISQLDESASKGGQQQDQFFQHVLEFKKKPVVIVRTVSRFCRIYKKGMERLHDIQQAGGRVIFGVPTEDGLDWFDTSSPSGEAKFGSQLRSAQQWTMEMSSTARDNAKRKRENASLQTQNSSKKQRNNKDSKTEVNQNDKRQHQLEIIQQALHRNNRDSFDLRRIIDWIRLARRGGSNLVVLNPFKDLINWNLWKRNIRQYTEWRTGIWEFTGNATKDPKIAQPNELSFDWIAVNLREWRVRMPPIRGLGNIRSGWSTELVEMMHDADGTNDLTRMMASLK